MATIDRKIVMNRSLSLLQNASKADVRTEPYSHIVVDSALPDDLYEELSRSFPSQYFMGIFSGVWKASLLRKNNNKIQALERQQTRMEEQGEDLAGQLKGKQADQREFESRIRTATESL